MGEQHFGDTLPLTFPPYYDQSVSSLPSLADAETPPSYESLWSEPRERYRIIVFRLKNSMGRFKRKTKKMMMGRTQFIVYGAFVINCIIFSLCFGLSTPKLADSKNWHTEDKDPVKDTKKCEDSLERIADILQWVCFVFALCAFCAVLFSIAQFSKSCIGRPYSTMIFLAAVNCLFTGAFTVFYFFVSWQECGNDIYLEQSLQLELMIFLMLALGTNAVYILIAVLFSLMPEYAGERSDSPPTSRRQPADMSISSIYDVGLPTARRGPANAIEERVVDAQRVNDMSIYIERCQINPPPPYQERQ